MSGARGRSTPLFSGQVSVRVGTPVRRSRSVNLPPARGAVEKTWERVPNVDLLSDVYKLFCCFSLRALKVLFCCFSALIVRFLFQ